MVTLLIIINVAVFILQNALNVFFPGVAGYPNQFMTKWFALGGHNFQELKVWTVLTYSFLHEPSFLLHILGNMFMLFMLGRILEPMLGRNRFLWFYLGSAFLSGLLYLVLHFNDRGNVIGASGAIMALLAFFCMLRPEQPITLLLFFVLPITVKPKWILRIGFAVSAFGLLMYELPGTGHVAHSAHLGGLLAGIAYYRFFFTGAPARQASGRSKPSIELPKWFKSKKQNSHSYSYKVNRTNRDELQKEVDRILDKINSSGFGSLSEEEKSTLDRAKDILSR